MINCSSVLSSSNKRCNIIPQSSNSILRHVSASAKEPTAVALCAHLSHLWQDNDVEDEVQEREREKMMMKKMKIGRRKRPIQEGR